MEGKPIQKTTRSIPPLQVKFIKSASAWQDLPEDGRVEHAFIGRSNVGKSSLVNMLLDRKALAFISSKPGKTQTLNFYLVNDHYYMVDLPGFGYAKTSKEARFGWARFIQQYLDKRENLQTIFHLIDSRHPPTELDESFIVWVKGRPVQYVIVMTKMDKLNQKERHQSIKQVQAVLLQYGLEVPVVQASTITKQGRAEILALCAS